MSKLLLSSLSCFMLISSLNSSFAEEEQTTEKPILKDQEWKIIGGKLTLVRKQVKPPEQVQKEHLKKQNVIDIKLDQQKKNSNAKQRKDKNVKVKWKWENGKLVSRVQLIENKKFSERRGPLLDVPHAPCAKTKKVRFRKGKNLDDHSINFEFTGKTFIKDVNQLHHHDCGPGSKMKGKNKKKSY